jgi:hypothetical protein
MTRPEPVQITYGGRAYNASYRVDGGVVSVESAYGSRSAALAASEPKAEAEALLRGLVEAWTPGGPNAKGPARTKRAGP